MSINSFSQRAFCIAAALTAPIAATYYVLQEAVSNVAIPLLRYLFISFTDSDKTLAERTSIADENLNRAIESVAIPSLLQGVQNLLSFETSALYGAFFNPEEGYEELNTTCKTMFPSFYPKKEAKEPIEAENPPIITPTPITPTPVATSEPPVATPEPPVVPPAQPPLTEEELSDLCESIVARGQDSSFLQEILDFKKQQGEVLTKPILSEGIGTDIRRIFAPNSRNEVLMEAIKTRRISPQDVSDILIRNIRKTQLKTTNNPQFSLTPQSIDELALLDPSNRYTTQRLLRLKDVGVVATTNKGDIQTGPIKNILPIRGDGDCYYRSVLVSILLQTLNDADDTRKKARIEYLLKKLSPFENRDDLMIINDHTKIELNATNTTHNNFCTTFLNRLRNVKDNLDQPTIKKFIEDLSQNDSHLDQGMIILARRIMVSELERRKGESPEGMTVEDACAALYSSLNDYLAICRRLGTCVEGPGVDMGILPRYLGCKQQLLAMVPADKVEWIKETLITGYPEPLADSPLKDLNVQLFFRPGHYDIYQT